MKISYLVGQDLATMRLNAAAIADLLECDVIFESGQQHATMGDHMLYMCPSLPKHRHAGSPVYEFGAMRDRILAHPDYAGRWREPLTSIQIVNTVDPEVYDALSEMFATEIGGNIAAEMKSIAEECDGPGYERPDPSEDLSPLEAARLHSFLTDDNSDKFDVGDLARLNSGGPDLTVNQVNEDDSVWCSWMDANGHHQDDYFPSACLTPVARQAPCAGDAL